MNSQPIVLQVVAAALIDSADRILIAQRPPGSHLAGGWEFPGGKLEPGEAPLDGLARELREELGIELAAGPHRPLRRISHCYSDRSVQITTWVVRDYAFAPRGMEGQALRWCPIADLEAADLLPADAPIVKALHLPERLRSAASVGYQVGLDRTAIIPGALWGVPCCGIEVALRADAAGAGFIVLNEPVADAALAALCRKVTVPVYARGVPLEQAWLMGATGLNELAV